MSQVHGIIPDVATTGPTAPMIGRAHEMTMLRDAWEQACAGEANAVVLAGDAGIGKTRLVAELADQARADGGLVLLGHCLGLGQAAPPFLPVLEVLSELRQQVTDAQLVERAEQIARAEVAGDQMSLFDGVHSLLQQASGSAPVLVAVEDLHWSDPSTRDLLLFLLARLDTSRVLLVLTYRSDDLNRQHPLRPWLAQVVRMRGVDRVDVEPWDREHAREFALSLLSADESDEALVADVVDRAEGNAFFLEELVSAARSGAPRLSGILTAVLLDRVERLSAAAQRVVRAAAVVGQRDLWAASLEGLVATEVVGLSPDEIDAALRDCVQSHVLVVAHDGAYAFRHALLREAILADMLPGESVRLHGAYIPVLEAEKPSGWQGAIAFHAARAGDLPRALNAEIAAATAAGEVAAHSDALAHLERALELWAAVPDAEAVTGTDELSLVLRACDEATTAGRHDRAISYGREAMTMADATEDVLRQAGARRRLAKLLYAVDDWRESERLIRQAWALLENEPATAERAWVLSTMSLSHLSGALHDEEGSPESQDLIERAISEARAVGAPGAEADALINLAFRLQHEGEIEAAMRHLTQAQEKASADGDAEIELRAYFNMAMLRFDRGEVEEAAQIALRGTELAADRGRRWAGYGRDAMWLLDQIEIVRGRFGALMERTSATLSMAPPSARPLIHASRTLAAAWLGQWDTVDREAAAIGAPERLAAQVLDGRLETPMAGYGIVHSWLWRGRHDLAEQALTTALDEVEVPDDLAEIRVCALLLAARAEAGQRPAGASGAPSSAEVLSRAERVAQVGLPRGQTLGPEGRLWLARARAEEARGRGQDSADLWRAVVEAASYGDRPHEATARWRLAIALLTGGDEAGRAELISAHAIAHELAAAPLQAATEATARRFKVVLPGAGGGDDLLTPRERSVLDHVARGLTNRAIGAELFISEKTVSVHLTRIMAKLGATSRTEAVAVAYSRGLI